MTGSELHSRRLRLGYSRDALAHAIGVSASTIAEWESGLAPITFPSALEQLLRQFESTSLRPDRPAPAGWADRDDDRPTVDFAAEIRDSDPIRRRH